ncbi:MAG: FecR family protein [Prolixibacteraceae bacterium]|jgi:ferric-dicitrate binding protein FerR (iron transport regulator)
MIKDSIYKDFTVEEFVQDKDFISWIVSPNEVTDGFWLNFQKEYPDKSESIELARRIVNALHFDETKIGREEYKDSLDSLKNYQRKSSERKNSGSGIFIRFSKIAAILLIPILAVNIYYLLNNRYDQTATQTIKYIVPEGQKSNVILADGTSVWLNSGSTLTVDANSPADIRKVKLSGEAYFEVVKDKQAPFLVETKDYTVKVYGTKFNVCSYDNSVSSQTTLKEGSISIITNTQDEIKVLPEQQFTLNNQKTYSLSKVNPDLFISWKDNVLKIDNEKLEDLVVRMEHWYGVQIHVDQFERVRDLRYTLTIKTESLKEMLEMMNFVTPVKYKIDGENVNLKYYTN